MRGLRPVHLALLAVPVLVVGLVGWQGRRLREDRGAVLAALRQAAGPELPPAPRAGASASEPTRYDRDSLYELVDGAAEAYLGRGYERGVAATYAFAGTPALEVAAEAHRFAAEGGARAQLEAERPGSAGPLPELAGAFTDGNVLVAVRGRDLLKLTALATAPEARRALLALATAWAAAKGTP